MTLLAWLPDGVVLVLWAIGATLGFGLVAGRLAAVDRLPAAADGGPRDRDRAAGPAVRDRDPVRQPRRLVSARLRRPAARRRCPEPRAGPRWPAASPRRCLDRQAPPGAAAAVDRAARAGANAAVRTARVLAAAVVAGLSVLAVEPADRRRPAVARLRPVVKAGAERGARRPPQHRPGLADRAGDRHRRGRAALAPDRRGGRRRRGDRGRGAPRPRSAAQRWRSRSRRPS